MTVCRHLHLDSKDPVNKSQPDHRWLFVCHCDHHLYSILHTYLTNNTHNKHIVIFSFSTSCHICTSLFQYCLTWLSFQCFCPETLGDLKKQIFSFQCHGLWPSWMPITEVSEAWPSEQFTIWTSSSSVSVSTSLHSQLFTGGKCVHFCTSVCSSVKIVCRWSLLVWQWVCVCGDGCWLRHQVW